MDLRSCAAFLDGASACAAERLTGRADAEGMSPAALLRLEALLVRCRKMLQVNTGVKHILGLLAVNAIP